MLGNVEKLCYTIPGQKFIMSRGGMSRGESTKKEMQSYSLYDVVMHYLRMTKQKDGESILVIKDLIVSGRHWSKFVHEKWEVDNKKT